VEERRAWISMRDGVRLASRIWIPDRLPAPALLEALPYRMDDLTASYASEYERLCAEGGFAVCRLDIRGTGSSEGIAEDEYTADELEDLCEVIAWLAAQEWSNGRVGMYGTSWSGFNSIQVACLRPPALHAIVPIYATDDRYTDDVHYMGGAVKALDLIDWIAYMIAGNLLPPVPAVRGEDWREAWLHRIEHTEPWVLRWLEEQHDGPYWRHGSLRPGYDRITAATMIVAGWADGYRNNTLRTFQRLRCPKRLLVGPWSHMSQATSLPGPHIDLVPELCRWFARWLRDDDNGIDREPPVVYFARRSTRPEPDLAAVRGEWRTEPTWPAERARTLTLRPGGEALDTIAVRGEVGTAAWISCGGKLPWGQPLDQRVDDAFSLTYDWEPLDAELELLGHPVLRLTVVPAAPVQYLSARLCDVFPDGTSTLVTRGVLNLAHRDGHDRPRPLEPGVPTPIELELEVTSWTFETGHRVRLALAGSDWPNTWPPPAGGTIVADRATMELELPVLDGPSPTPSPTLPPTTGRDTHSAETDEPQPPVTWTIAHDVLARQVRAVTSYGAVYNGPFDAHVREIYDGEVGVSTSDPADAWASAVARYDVTWPEAGVSAEARLDVRSDADTYHVVVEASISDDHPDGIGQRERRWERAIPRRLA
jgi:hypothetical protein